MAQHIPGPYAFDLDEGAIESADGVQIATIPSVDEFPCRNTEEDDQFEAELVATGRLLAAAPELLIAGKHLAVKLAEAYRAAGANPAGCQAVCDWMAVVSKLEGR